MNDKLCSLCQTNEGKYICPACNIFYCSVVCYRSEQHLQCSELFYKKCVEEELRFEKSFSSNEIVSALRRTEDNFSHEPLGVADNDEDGDDGEDQDQGEDESDKDSDDDDDIAKRMENVDLNDSDMLWQKLTSEERKEFLNMVSNGKIRRILPEWTPWWKFFKNKLVIDTESENQSNSEDNQCPFVDVLIPPLSDITKKTPSENIPFIMVNILLAYACTARWFKGKHCDMPVEGVTTLTALSSVLRDSKVFGSLVEAYAEFENDLHNCQWLRQDTNDPELIWEDVVDIVNGSNGQDSFFGVKACVCDIRDMVDKALKILRDSTELKCFTGSKPTLLQLKLLSKKMFYYLSWITSCGQLLRSKISEGHS